MLDNKPSITHQGHVQDRRGQHTESKADMIPIYFTCQIETCLFNIQYFCLNVPHLNVIHRMRKKLLVSLSYFSLLPYLHCLSCSLLLFLQTLEDIEVAGRPTRTSAQRSDTRTLANSALLACVTLETNRFLLIEL